MLDKDVNNIVLSCENLAIGYSQNGRTDTILSDLNLSLSKGQLTALMGVNGSGKSTLIRTLCHLQNAVSGSININGEPMSSINVAKYIAVVLTSPVYAPNFTVFDMVSTGRIPHTNWLGRMSTNDIDIVNKSIAAVEIQALADRLVSQLSDGERQKMMIAKALAQESPIIVLDEPTAHLDMVNRVEVSKLLRKLAHYENKTILLATHELDLAIQTADRVWLLDDDKIHIGAPEDLIINEYLQNTFAKMSIDFDHISGSFRVKPQNIIPIRFIKSNNSIIELWTERLLNKFGFYISENDNTELSLNFDVANKIWTFKDSRINEDFNSLASLGDKLRNVIISQKK